MHVPLSAPRGRRVWPFGGGREGGGCTRHREEGGRGVGWRWRFALPAATQNKMIVGSNAARSGEKGGRSISLFSKFPLLGN